MSLPTSASPIGVFDSGVGGLSVLQELRSELPHERFIYLADSGNAPYGERGDEFVKQRTLAITRYLLDKHHIKALVVACNTATTAAVSEVRAAFPDLPVIGVEPALKPAASSSQTHRVGVIATRGTLLNDMSLCGEALVLEREASYGGRPATRYRYNPDFYSLLSLYVTGSDEEATIAWVM